MRDMMVILGRRDSKSLRLVETHDTQILDSTSFPLVASLLQYILVLGLSFEYTFTPFEPNYLSYVLGFACASVEFLHAPMFKFTLAETMRGISINDSLTYRLGGI